MKKTKQIFGKAKSKARQICLASVCAGIVCDILFYFTGIFDLGCNVITIMPAIIIIGGTTGYTFACKHDSKY